MTNAALQKKTLVISSWAPPMKGASPHFFYNLFSHFDPATYALFTDHTATNETLEHPRLPCSYFYFNDPSTIPLSSTSTSKLIRILAKVLFFFVAVRTGLHIIRTERIELLLATSDNGRALLLTFVLSLLSQRPYVLYFLDLYRWNQLGMVWSLFAHVFEPVLFRYAKTIFVMGDGHRALYEQKYGTRFSYTVIRNCPLPSAPHIRKERSGPPYTILYSGNVYWPQEQAIRNLIQAVTTIELDVRILLYTPRHLSRFEAEFKDTSRVQFCSASQEAMADIQNNADILFLPLSFNTEAREVIEMAVPGKTAEYLMAGRPILVHAPPYAFLSTYAKEKQFAHVVDTADIEMLQAGIRRLILDTDYARKLTANARTLFKEEYDDTKNAVRLKERIDWI